MATQATEGQKPSGSPVLSRAAPAAVTGAASVTAQRRRPDFHLPLGAAGGPRPRPRLDTTERALLSLGAPSDNAGMDLTTPVLSAALGASPLSSSGPLTPLGCAKLRSPSIIGLSPTANPYQVLMPPPVPALPASSLLGTAAGKLPVRAWTSMSHIDQETGHLNPPPRVGSLHRSQSEQDVVAMPADGTTPKTGRSIMLSLLAASHYLARPNAGTRGAHLARIVRCSCSKRGTTREVFIEISFLITGLLGVCTSSLLLRIPIIL
jgi:hypothetical protein